MVRSSSTTLVFNRSRTPYATIVRPVMCRANLVQMLSSSVESMRRSKLDQELRLAFAVANTFKPGALHISFAHMYRRIRRPCNEQCHLADLCGNLGFGRLSQLY